MLCNKGVRGRCDLLSVVGVGRLFTLELIADDETLAAELLIFRLGEGSSKSLSLMSENCVWLIVSETLI